MLSLSHHHQNLVIASLDQAEQKVAKWFNQSSKTFSQYDDRWSLDHQDVSVKQNSTKKIPEQPWVCEISTEVCNKVGGIYTVLKTKAASFKQELGNRYVLIGPRTSSQSMEELISECPAKSSPLRKSIETLKASGMEASIGRWNVEGRPWTVLLDFAFPLNASIESRIIKSIEKYLNIKLPRCAEIIENVKFGYLVARFVKALRECVGEREPIVSHFHEWMTAFGLFFLSDWRVRFSSIFTTHATILGRYICAEGGDFYKEIANYDPMKQASRLGILHIHRVENSAILLANVVTTVSHVTGLELRHLHGRVPDFITPNGLNVQSYNDDWHSIYRKNIDEFVRAHFFRNFPFDKRKVIYIFSAGRNEFRNKGIDFYIESLARLNHRLVISDKDVIVVAFLIFPTATEDLNQPTIRRRSDYHYLRKKIKELTTIHGERALDFVLHEGRNIQSKADPQSVEHLRKVFSCTRQKDSPPITTHNIVDNDSDLIVQALKRCNLLNAVNDRVKVVYHPEFLVRENPLFSLDYQDFVSGCHLGVFPSFYEPWGYTPAESNVRGTPAITSNLTGYGKFVSQMPDCSATNGIYVIDRLNKSPEESLEQLVDMMMEFLNQSPEQRRLQRLRTAAFGKRNDWSELSSAYFKAIQAAINKHN